MGKLVKTFLSHLVKTFFGTDKFKFLTKSFETYSFKVVFKIQKLGKNFKTSDALRNYSWDMIIFFVKVSRIFKHIVNEDFLNKKRCARTALNLKCDEIAEI